MAVLRVIAVLCLSLLWPLFSAQALYGTVEFSDGRTITGRIKPSQSLQSVQSSDKLGLFVPKENANLLLALVEIKRIQFTWHHNPSGRQPYFLQQPGDIRVTMISGEVVEGAYFGTAPGAREFIVVLDNFEQVPLALNDTKRTLGDCIRSIDFQTIAVPEPGPVSISLATGQAQRIDFSLAVESADLLAAAGGEAIAKVHAGARFTALEQKGDWIKVRTAGPVEVEGWLARSSLKPAR